MMACVSALPAPREIAGATVVVIGAGSAEATLVVRDADTAIALGSGDVPVLGTPRLAALVELAARSAVADLLDGQTTVGASIELQHLAASILGASVRARATILERTHRRIDFEFEAIDLTP